MRNLVILHSATEFWKSNHWWFTRNKIRLGLLPTVKGLLDAVAPHWKTRNDQHHSAKHLLLSRLVSFNKFCACQSTQIKTKRKNWRERESGRERRERVWAGVKNTVPVWYVWRRDYRFGLVPLLHRRLFHRCLAQMPMLFIYAILWVESSICKGVGPKIQGDPRIGLSSLILPWSSSRQCRNPEAGVLCKAIIRGQLILQSPIHLF